MDRTILPDFPHVVALGGGHGLGRLLSALQGLGDRLTGIVTTSDNGGSSGRLRRNENCIAWGDLRNCLNQLVTRQTVGSSLFEYRFEGEGELSGHNLGNLILLALDKMSVRPVHAINLIRNMLKIKTHLFPMSEIPTDLLALGPCGTQLLGETSIDAWHQLPSQLALHPQVTATPEAIAAIVQADLLLIGPGSFMTSLLPPLLLPEIASAIRQNPAPLLFTRNLVAEQGPSGQLTLEGQLEWLTRLIGRTPDGVLTQEPGTQPGVKVHACDLAEPGCHWRHDRDKLRQGIEQLSQLLLQAQMLDYREVS